MGTRAVIAGLFLGLGLFLALIGTNVVEQTRTATALIENLGQSQISVAMKQKEKVTLLAIKNIDAAAIYEFKIRIIDGDIKFIKARGWDRDRVDQSTVTMQTNSRPISTGKSLIVMLIASTNRSYEWVAFGENKNEIAEGNLANVTQVPRAGSSEFEFDIKEYSFPDATSYPIFPLYDQKRDVIWISDFTHPRIWKFIIQTGEFEFFSHDGKATVKLAFDSKGRIWFIDTKAVAFGYIDPDTGSSKTFKPPVEGFINDLQVDTSDNVWFSVPDKSKIIRFDHTDESFKVFDLDEKSRPAAILIDASGRVWFTDSGVGKIGVIDPVSDKITAYKPPTGRLIVPSSILQDSSGNIWIGEHGGTNITRFNTESFEFERYVVPDEGAMVVGMVEDGYGNIWYAEHVTDNIAVLNPQTGLTKLIRVPTIAPSVQWLTIDKQGTIWFTEPNNAKIGSITISTMSVK